MENKPRDDGHDEKKKEGKKWKDVDNETINKEGLMLNIQNEQKNDEIGMARKKKKDKMGKMWMTKPK